MPNSRSVYNFVKLEIGKAPRDAGGAPGPGSIPAPPAPLTRRPKPHFCSPGPGNPLPGQPTWRRGGAESAESPSGNAAGRLCGTRARAAAATASEGRRGHRAALAPRPAFLQLATRLTGQRRRKCPFPTPILARGRQPGDAALALGCGQFRRLWGGKAKCHPLPSSEANDDAERSRPLPTPWEPLIRSRRRRASKGLDLRASQVPSASRTPRGPRKADRQFSFPVVHSPAHARSSAATFPGISHRKWSGPTQCRRWCSWHNYSDGPPFVQSHNNPLLCALSGRSRRGLCRADPACPRRPRRDADFGLGSAVEDHPGLSSVALLRGSGAESVSLFDLRRELKFPCDQTILKY
ncbi:uncharacterized protein LOC125960372 [Orcinus orca]|uniref:uncharacterized protein LOC125960372 n=1 Tax=Orcinus orca TaxID=9733 RepID=UPI002112DAFE|nr:uncharacterized protein LOC125960372 [Orcinus orca]